jgi:hypothetical protein
MNGRFRRGENEEVCMRLAITSQKEEDYEPI